MFKGPLQKSLPLNIPAQNELFFDGAEALGVPRNEETVYCRTHSAALVDRYIFSRREMALISDQ